MMQRPLTSASLISEPKSSSTPYGLDRTSLHTSLDTWTMVFSGKIGYSKVMKSTLLAYLEMNLLHRTLPEEALLRYPLGKVYCGVLSFEFYMKF